jgi:hypothetical protein
MLCFTETEIVRAELDGTIVSRDDVQAYHVQPLPSGGYVYHHNGRLMSSESPEPLAEIVGCRGLVVRPDGSEVAVFQPMDADPGEGILVYGFDDSSLTHHPICDSSISIYAPTGEFIVGNLRLYFYDTEYDIISSQRHSGSRVTSLAVSPNSEFVVVLTDLATSIVRIRDQNNLWVLRDECAHGGFLFDNSLILVDNRGKCFHLNSNFDTLESMEVRSDLDNESIAPDGSVVGHRRNSVAVWNSQTGEERCRLVFKARVRGVRFVNGVVLL